MQRTGIILAAGEGTRMKSDLPKVLHEAGGCPLLGWVVQALQKADVPDITVVVGSGADQVRERFAGEGLSFVEQKERLGSGHAARTAADAMAPGQDGYTFIAAGDMPLLTAQTVREMFEQAERKRLDCVLLTAIVQDPTGYGRIVRDESGQVVLIVEHKDASDEQRTIREVNASCYCVRTSLLLSLLPTLEAQNAQGEYYLTDIIGKIRQMGGTVAAFLADEEECLGVNDRRQLAEASRRLYRRTADRHMAEGVTIMDPATTYIDPRTEIGRDTIIYPGVIMEDGCRIGGRATIYQGCRLVASSIGDGAEVQNSVLLSAKVGEQTTVGPYAYLRPGASVGSRCRVGDFVELKNCNIGDGTKVSHLTYIGDADFGRDINVGCGVVVVNYDGKRKYRSTVEDGAFVGCNTNLVSPVTVGEGAYIAAGATITEDVPAGTLAIARSRQVIKAEWKDRRS